MRTSTLWRALAHPRTIAIRGATALLATVVGSTGAVGPASAQGFGPHKGNYIGTYMPGGQQDNQMAFQVSQGFEVWDPDLFGVKVRGAFTQTSRGLVNEDSAPFQHDFKPETYLTRDLFWPGVDIDFGWEHGSTGVAGDESRSWDREFLRVRFERRVGPLWVQAWPTLWWAFHVSPDTEDVLEARRFSGRFGGEMWGRVMYEDKLLVDFEVDSGGRVQWALGFNTLRSGEKKWYTTLYGFTGSGKQLVDLATSETGWGVGATFVP